MATRTSVSSGNWSNGATWGGSVPGAGDKAVIATGHTVTLQIGTADVMGVLVNGTLEFNPLTSVTLNSTRNIELRNGRLRMRPNNSSIKHVIRMNGINMSNFVGGGDDVLESDIGLWVMGNSQLDILGTSKRRWTRATGSIAQGATSVIVQDASGWLVGDEIAIATMDTPNQFTADWDDNTGQLVDNFAKRTERRIITNITGNTISWVGGLSYAHQVVVSNVSDPDLGSSSKIFLPEIANLSSNCVFRGNPGQHTHIFVKSNLPQSVYFLEEQYTGPRKMQGRRRPDLISGRYGFHYHHSEEGARGSINFGGVIKDSGNRCYVVHGSHGVTQNNNVVMQSSESAFWWDFQHISHDCTWEDNLFMNITQNGLDAVSQGMLLQMGDGNKARRNVGVYACSGDAHSGGCYTWIDNTEGIWIFEDNMAHSSSQGLFVWQNTSFNHTIINYNAFNCWEGINHGAYINSYTYRYGHLHNAPVHMKATSGNTEGALLMDMFFHGGGREYCGDYIDSPVPSDPTKTNKFVRCVFTGYTNQAIELHTEMEDSNVEKQYKHIDFINCKFNAGGIGYHWNQNHNFPMKDFWNVRVQPISGQCYQTRRTNQQNVNTNISRFAPDRYDTGFGLKGDYYNGSNFNSFAFTRLDSMIMFQQWTIDPAMAPFGVHHLIVPLNSPFYSVRWTGKVMPQFTENHKFIFSGSSSCKLWINNNLILNSGELPDNDVRITSPDVFMQIGTKYDIKLEITNSGGQRGAQLFWQSPSIPYIRNVPMSQLFTGNEAQTTGQPTTFQATTPKPPTTAGPTVAPTTKPITTVGPTTVPPTTLPVTTFPGQTTLPVTTGPVTTLPAPTTLPPTTPAPTTVPPTTFVAPTTANPYTMAYNPSLHTVTPKALAVSSAAPDGARSYYYDEQLFKYRPYQNRQEVLAYLDTAAKRTGHFPIFINEGGTLVNGVFTGGVLKIYYFRNGVNDEHLTDGQPYIALVDQTTFRKWIVRIAGGALVASEAVDQDGGSSGHVH